LRCHNYDFNVFASAGRDGNVLLWDVRVPEKSNNFGVAVKAPVIVLHGAHTIRKPGGGRRTPSSSSSLTPDAERGLSGAKSVTGLVFALDDTMLVSSGADGRIKYWDVRKVSFQTTVGVTDPRPVVSWDVRPPYDQAEPAGVGSSRPHGITCITLNRFGSRLAAFSLDNHIYEYDFYAPEDTTSLRCFDAPVTSFYAKIAYSPDGAHLAAGSSATQVCVFDTRASDSLFHAGSPGAAPLRRLEGHSQSALGVDWSPMEQQIASCSDDGTTRLWTVQANRGCFARRGGR
jgi:WD40 repeat protein